MHKIIRSLLRNAKSEYSQLNPIIPRREEIKRILVFFGGADNDTLTLKTLEAVNSNEYDDII